MPDYDLIVLQAVAVNGDGRPVSMMVDTGCSVSCMPRPRIRRLRLPIRRLRNPVTVAIANGSTYAVTHEAKLIFRIGGYQSMLWVHESVGMLRSCDMLLGMDWMMVNNPKISFDPLSMQVEGQDLTRYMTIRDRATGGYGLGRRGHGRADCRCPGGHGRYLPGGDRTREKTSRDLSDLRRLLGVGGGSGFSGEYSGGYNGGWGRHGPPLITVFQNVETADEEHSPFHQTDTAGKECDIDKEWADWEETCSDIACCNTELNTRSHSSMIFKAPSLKSPNDKERSAAEATRAWIEEQALDHYEKPAHRRQSSPTALRKAKKTGCCRDKI